MLGPKANDVFVFAVPEKVMRDTVRAYVEEWNPPVPDLSWDGNILSGSESQGRYGRYGTTYGEINANDMRYVAKGEKRYSAYYFPGGYHSTEEAEYLPDFDDPEEAKRAVEAATVKSYVRGYARGKKAYEDQVAQTFGRVDESWHPDRDVPMSIGWARLLVYPPQTVVVVEIQSDREWMGFRYQVSPWPLVQTMLRKLYFETFAADALNFIVEWAFNNRYGEVLVLDHDSRKKLGGSPPKSFYDDFPKKYTISQPVPLVSGPFDYIRLYDWVPKDLKVRRIIPNRRG